MLIWVQRELEAEMRVMYEAEAARIRVKKEMERLGSKYHPAICDDDEFEPVATISSARQNLKSTTL